MNSSRSSLSTAQYDDKHGIHMDKVEQELETLVERILTKAQKNGATAAEVSVADSAGLEVTVRQRTLETVEFHRDRRFGITVYLGQQKGSVSTTDTRESSITEIVHAALNMARFTEADSCNGLADSDLMATEFPDLDLYHPEPLDTDTASERALAAEAAALDSDKRIVNSQGAQVYALSGCITYGNSHGFLESVRSTKYGTSVSVVAQDDISMQTDYWYSVGRVENELEANETVGKEAARRAVARLGKRKIKTDSYPVLFDPQMAKTLLGSLTDAISGGVLYRGASFLLNSLGSKVAIDGMTLRQQPHVPKGLASAAFDSDGVGTRNINFIDKGIVSNYVLSTYSARRLGMGTTGNSGGTFNLEVKAETQPIEELIRSIRSGFLVTQLMGQGVNLVTGDYSRGAAGIWIKSGELIHAVDEITIAGNLKDMLNSIVGFGDDTDIRGGIRTGSILVDHMTVAATT